MATKTLTITEDAYSLLAERKAEGESFSEEIRRLLTKKGSKSIWDYFGVLSYEEGETLLKDLKKMREINLNAVKERIA
ncbi:antitoxin VapB family protein [Candidatus Woesearchaeota archaeon]|nr:antitoxin VapB family protein [Candidatus Woesearchaeota archaeon]